MPKQKLRFKQLVAGQFQAPRPDLGQLALNYSMIGLAEDGTVWRYDVGCFGWIPYNMEVADCDQHRR